MGDLGLAMRMEREMRWIFCSGLEYGLLYYTQLRLRGRQCMYSNSERLKKPKKKKTFTGIKGGWGG